MVHTLIVIYLISGLILEFRVHVRTVKLCYCSRKLERWVVILNHIKLMREGELTHTTTWKAVFLSPVSGSPGRVCHHSLSGMRMGVGGEI